MRKPLRCALALLTLGATMAFAGCSTPAGTASPVQDASPTTAGETSGFPRTIEHDAGRTTIPTAPVRIVSTSPSLTGSLLAFEAPVLGSAATTPSAMTDAQGFFTQWAPVAKERGVEVVYGNLELDMDAIEKFSPDLIIGSANGGDSTLDAYAQLSEIAPTVLINYGKPSWQELTTELAHVVGLESKAEQILAGYDSWVADQSALLEVPEQPTTAGAYMGADGLWTFGQESAQAKLLESLGFTYAAADGKFVTPESKGSSVPVLTAENMSGGLSTVQTMFIVPMGTEGTDAQFAADPLAANIPAVAAGRVESLGATSFRLDYFSAKDTVAHLVSQFGK